MVVVSLFISFISFKAFISFLRLYRLYVSFLSFISAYVYIFGTYVLSAGKGKRLYVDSVRLYPLQSRTFMANAYVYICRQVNVYIVLITIRLYLLSKCVRLYPECVRKVFFSAWTFICSSRRPAARRAARRQSPPTGTVVATTAGWARRRVRIVGGRCRTRAARPRRRRRGEEEGARKALERRRPRMAREPLAWKRNQGKCYGFIFLDKFSRRWCPPDWRCC